VSQALQQLHAPPLQGFDHRLLLLDDPRGGAAVIPVPHVLPEVCQLPAELLDLLVEQPKLLPQVDVRLVGYPGVTHALHRGRPGERPHPVIA